MLNTGGNLAGIVGTPLTALLFAQFGWTAALGAGVVFALLAAALWLFIRVDEPLTVEGEMSRPSMRAAQSSPHDELIDAHRFR